ncbi:MAG TPA: hypothetical protein PLU81_04545 [Deltaproteobacteria bacterium]|nr:hypothetical protein [Deltaproteobacteria bacterium]HPJ92864.1 hypothetical protein [Deltaproteobacteria bacterium]HPR51031.1 hypothetical protein [Deltaproteobacteria bacterium]
MSFIFGLIKWAILAPFKIIKFVVADVVIFGIIGGTLSLIKSVIKILFKPISLAIILGGALACVAADEEKRNKVKALIGM